jgi:hypothetical protein
MSAANTKYELEQAEQEFRKARVLYEEARQERNALILRALKEAVRPVDVAEITGLTRSRIAQIQPKRRKKH